MKIRFVGAAASGGALFVQSSARNEPGATESSTPSYSKALRIGIIGGGLGGTATAYFLREQFGEKCKNGLKLSIDLIEKDKIGGRLSTEKIGDRFYESGGSIIHEKNEYMQQFVKKFGLKKRDESASSRLGLWNGSKFVFSGTDSDIFTSIKLLFRYGWDIVRLRKWINSMLKKFCRIYDLQEKGVSFDTVDELLSAMDPSFAHDMRCETLNDKLRKQSYSSRFIDELGAAATRANYGQLFTMPAFVGYVSLCGAMPGLWSVHGGNKKVAQALLESSKANTVSGEVVCVSRNECGTYTVRYSHMDTFVEKEYDVVVMAVPFILGHSTIRFKDIIFKSPLIGPYQQTVASLVKGLPKYCNFGKSANRCPSDIICVNPNTVFSTLAPQTPVDYQKSEKVKGDVWKLFSAEKLNSYEMKALFDVIDQFVVVPWMAYPLYNLQDIPLNLDFCLGPGLYYVNCIEWAASCMEMSVIGAKNVSLLISQNTNII